ncbi:MAG: lamin tail domain-containing protein [Bacteroidales bacterium]|nr:lamin tail domain-containing protein [Bacteroidales bacterium]
MDTRKLFLTAAAIVLSLQALAQNVSDLIISEVMAVPDESSVVDGYGEKTGWIELFNTSQGTVNFGGCFLTDDPSDLRKSPISGLDRSTRLGPRQSVVFYASGHGSDGTYYTNFPVRAGSTVYLVSNDGRTIVDSIEIPADIPAGKSVSKFAHDYKAVIFDDVRTTSPTPGSYNAGGSLETGAQKVAREDPHGWILTLVSVSVVFFALMLLWWLFAALFGQKKKKTPASKGMNPEVAAAISMALQSEFGSEVYAAIGLALHEYLQDTVHDNESFIITIRPSEGSQWASKSQGFRRYPALNRK